MAYKKPALLSDILHKNLPDSLTNGLNNVKVIEAWTAVLGPLMARYSANERFADGTLTVSIQSSVLRNELFMQRAVLIEKINAYLHGQIVRSIVLH